MPTKGIHRLPELQEELSQFIFFGKELDRALFSSTHPVSTDRGLEIYRKNLFFSCFDALSETFPITKEILSEEVFKSVTAKFIQSCPPRHQNLNRYGERFPDLLKQVDSIHAHPYLSDLAIFEWLWDQVFYVPDAKPLALTRLKSWEDLPLSKLFIRLIPSVSLQNSRFRILDIWKSRAKLDCLEPSETKAIVWRENNERCASEVEPELWPFLDSVREKISLQELTQNEYFKRHPKRLFESLYLATNRGWLVGG